ncbi:hypothetical protein QFZ53_001084 [Microbacterium natoriense]|uniref:Uncharacterized protein n=1 Tax=Microbacterium natoriense TaxID=284570 RepID=A0AAW8ETT6_9MICO|nr:hypothetical protein [Microbacterium natoriense]
MGAVAQYAVDLLDAARAPGLLSAAARRRGAARP